MPPRPFRIEVPDATLADLRERLTRVRWPDQAPGAELSRPRAGGANRQSLAPLGSATGPVR